MNNKSRKKIFFVDDNLTCLAAGRTMLKDYYEVYPIPSATKLFKALERVSPALILLDVMMPEMDGFTTLAVLKGDKRWRDIPVIFLTSRTDENSEVKGLSLGAIDYVTKPMSAQLLLSRIANHLLMIEQRRELENYTYNLELMVELKTDQVVNLQDAILNTMAEIVEFRDNLTGGHVSRTQKYIEVLIDQMLEEKIGLSAISHRTKKLLIQSAQLHDVGKIAISDAILNKPGPLTEDEFEIIKTHVQHGVEAIESIKKKTNEKTFLTHAAIFAGAHHEKWDGSGYPNNLKGEQIPIQGRLMAIADVYDALISTRPYKQPLPPSQASQIIVAGRGTHFDPQLVDIFIKIAHKFEKIALDKQ
ncbi:MAG: response regulator [Deltaproteobacteria bacterium]|jgi:putative two-component system response regulator|nr:response regulator [Deltaproteobacteria bacterium]